MFVHACMEGDESIQIQSIYDDLHLSNLGSIHPTFYLNGGVRKQAMTGIEATSTDSLNNAKLLVRFSFEIDYVERCLWMHKERKRLS